MRTNKSFVIIVLLMLFLSLIEPALAAPGDITRVSVDSDGLEGNSGSYRASISADGRFVAFDSFASNLAANDTNSSPDVFVHDRQTGATSRVSISSDGVQAANGAQFPAISGDGRFVVFQSVSNDLVAEDTNGTMDIFVHDRNTGQTTRVSVSSDGTQGNWHSEYPDISADGRYIAFRSSSTNLVDEDTNDKIDVFVHDRQTGETTRVSVKSDGTQMNSLPEYWPSISDDGRFVTFYTSATNLVLEDTDTHFDIYVHDRQTALISLVSVSADGEKGNQNSGEPAISGDGRYVVFHSVANNLVANDTNGCMDVFLRDRQSAATTRISVDSNGVPANDRSGYPSISADGRYIAFTSFATNLTETNTNGLENIYLHDRQTGVTELVSVNSNGTPLPEKSQDPAISADGKVVAFESDATTLVPNDTNTFIDIFVYQPSLPIAPAITSMNYFDMAEGVTDDFIITTTGYPLAAISLSGTLPEDVSFTDNGDGTALLAGTPASGSFGVYPLTVTAGNGVSPDASQNFTLTVYQPPTISSANHFTCVIGAETTFFITTSGFPTPSIGLSGNLPDGIEFTDNGDGTASLAGTPQGGTSGVYVLSVTVTNGVSPDAEQEFSIRVITKVFLPLLLKD